MLLRDTFASCLHEDRSFRQEKDLQADPKEMELARQLSDCLSVALDSVLCSTRLHEEKPRSREDVQILGTLRNRAHMIIR